MRDYIEFISSHTIEWFTGQSGEVIILDHLRGIDGTYITELCQVTDMASARRALGY